MYVIITDNRKVLEVAKRFGAKIVPCTSDANERIEEPERLDCVSFISSTLLALGIPAHVKGFKYLQNLLEMSITDENFQNYRIFNDVYPKIAQKYNTAPANVERAIRNCIEVIFKNNHTKLLDELFCNTLEVRDKPTNGEFIGALSMYLKEKLK